MTDILAPFPGTVVIVGAVPGAAVLPATELFVVESMKVEHPVTAGVAGTVTAIHVAVGTMVQAGARLASVDETAPESGTGTVTGTDTGTESEREAGGETSPAAAALRAAAGAPGRPDLDAVVARHAGVLDGARPGAVARRRASGQRTTRENIDDLVDPGSFFEYGSLVIAAQRTRKSVEELIEQTPADGLVAGVGRVDGHPVAVAAYDYTVLAGTQGVQGHRKTDRIIDVAGRQRIPLVLFAEGGGGRPGDQDRLAPTGLDEPTFAAFARLSGLVPTVGITSGFCFAGNAALLACCDLIVATAGSNIGMGGPAMVEGGGLGRFAPTEIGPVDDGVANGVVDLLAADEAGAVSLARRYLAYFRPAPEAEWSAADQSALRSAVPEDRRRAYDVRALIATLFDTASVLEVRRGFAPAMVTALVRLEGRAVGVVANDSTHLGGAVDAAAADKAARFLGLCDAFDLPVVFLCDTPGFMVGPDEERRGLVRHAGRLFNAGANLSVPYGTVILRKGYGLGAMAMSGGGFKAGLFTLSWPTGEFGGMNLDGAARLGYRREVEAIADPDERERFLAAKTAGMVDRGRALNAATYFEFDDVIDPAATRRWMAAMFDTSPAPAARAGKKRPFVDTW